MGQDKATQREIESENKQFALARESNALNSTNEQVLMESIKERSDLIFWQQDLSQSLEILKNKLRNRQFDVVNQRWIPKTKPMFNTITREIEHIEIEPLLTEEGITMIENQLSCFLGSEAKNLINSNLDEARILKLLEDTANVVADSLVDGYDIYFYEVPPSDKILDQITRLVKNAMIPTAFRAINGWTKVQDNTSIKRVDTFTGSAEQPQKKSFLAF